jgi:hypothetical protein
MRLHRQCGLLRGQRQQSPGGGGGGTGGGTGGDTGGGIGPSMQLL